MVEYAWIISVVGNFMTLGGAIWTAKAVILTEQQAVEIASSVFSGPNLRLRDALLAQSKSAKHGLYWVGLGTALQIIREFIEHLPRELAALDRVGIGMRTVFAVVLAVLSATATAGAQDQDSANYRMEGCRAAIKISTTFSSGYCAGLVAGVAFGGHGTTFCIPADVTTGHMVRVVVTYIDTRPARMHEDFRKLAREALIDAWPCKPANPPNSAR